MSLLHTRVQETMATMNPKVVALLEPHLLGVFVIKDFGGTAYSETIIDNGPQGGFLALDRDALERSANAWATWKERNPFVGEGRQRLHVTLEEEAKLNFISTSPPRLLQHISVIFTRL